MSRCSAYSDDGARCPNEAEPHSAYCVEHREDFGAFRGWTHVFEARRQYGADAGLIAGLFARSPRRIDPDADDPASRERMEEVDLSALLPEGSRLLRGKDGFVYRPIPWALYRLRDYDDEFGLRELATPSTVTKIALQGGRRAWDKIRQWKIGPESLDVDASIARSFKTLNEKGAHPGAFNAERRYARHFRQLLESGHEPIREGERRLARRSAALELAGDLASFLVRFEEGQALLTSLQAGGPLEYDDGRRRYVPVKSKRRDMQRRRLSDPPRLWAYFKIAIAGTYLHLEQRVPAGGTERRWNAPHALADGRRAAAGKPAYKTLALELTRNIAVEMEPTWLGDLEPEHVKTAVDWALA